MPTIRLEFDVDSELYPELHAALSRLGSTRARGERMRQLAAAGLVWENVRIHGASAIGPNAPAEVPADVTPRRSPAPGRALAGAARRPNPVRWGCPASMKTVSHWPLPLPAPRVAVEPPKR